MADRSLVAYRRADGSFALHYAHWGLDLADRIGPATPLGGPVDAADPSAVADRVGLDRWRAARAAPTRVDPRPVATGLDAEAVLAAVDASAAALVVVSPDLEATTLLVCSLDPLAGASADEAAEPGQSGRERPRDRGRDLVLVEPAEPPASLRAWYAERKSAVGAAVAAGRLPPAEGRRRLLAALAARAAAVRSPDDAGFLRRA